MRSQRSNTLACPAIAVACDETIAVQDAGDEIVIGERCQLVHSDEDVGGGAVALPASSPGQAHFAVSTADPVDDENDLFGFRIDVPNHLLDQRAHVPFLQS